jgi:hypothetical protein
MANDLTKFKKRISIKATVPALYLAWSTRQGIESWFLRQAKFVSPEGQLKPPNEPTEAGDGYEWPWHGWPDNVAERNKILKANGKI